MHLGYKLLVNSNSTFEDWSKRNVDKAAWDQKKKVFKGNLFDTLQVN